MTLPPSAPALCSSCRFPLDEYKAGQRHYGTHTAHAEWYCIQRLCNEVDRLRASLGAIHCRVCHGASTPGMGEAIARECEHAVPELKSLRAALKEPT